MEVSIETKTYYVTGTSDHRAKLTIMLETVLECRKTSITFLRENYLEGSRIFVNETFTCADGDHGFILELIIEDSVGLNSGKNLSFEYRFNGNHENWEEMDVVSGILRDILIEEDIHIESELDNEDDYDLMLEKVLVGGLTPILIMYA